MQVKLKKVLKGKSLKAKSERHFSLGRPTFVVNRPCTTCAVSKAKTREKTNKNLRKVVKFSEKSKFSRHTDTGESVGLQTNLVSEILLVFAMAESPKAGGGDIAARVAAQGDLVRKLKQEKADKEKVRKE